MDQITLDYDIKITEFMQASYIVKAIRPEIDSVLDAFNLSPRHVSLKEISSGYSFAFSISPSTLQADSDNESSPRCGVICRVKDQKTRTFLEFPSDRSTYYSKIGEITDIGAVSGCLRINLDSFPDTKQIGTSICEDIKDRLLHFPSDFACCDLYVECSNAEKCIAKNQDLAAGCYYKRNLMSKRFFYGYHVENGGKKMISPSDPPLIRFESEDEKLKYFRLWGLVSAKARSTVPVVYNGYYTDCAVPCEVVGRTWEDTAVIKVGSQLHCIDGNYLAALQPTFKVFPRRKVPYTKFLEDYVVVDIETSGFQRYIDSIIEIAACRYSNNKKISQFSTLVNSCSQIPWQVQRLTHITPQMLSTAPSAEDVSSRFFEYIGDLPVVGHNILSFDLPFIEAFFHREIGNQVVDTLRLAKDKYPGLSSYKLSALVDTLKLPVSPTHRALKDVEATAALFWACVSKTDPIADD